MRTEIYTSLKKLLEYSNDDEARSFEEHVADTVDMDIDTSTMSVEEIILLCQGHDLVDHIYYDICVLLKAINDEDLNS